MSKPTKTLNIAEDIKNYKQLPWKIKSGSIDEIVCINVFEFIPGETRGKFMDEVYRVLSNIGKATFIVPYWNSAIGIQDYRYQYPPLVEQSFMYFNKGWREANNLKLGIICDFDFCVSPETLVLTSDL